MAKQNKNNRPSEVRVIAGQWRGRKIAFTEVEGLRPTSDRIRETLFNWLQEVVGQSRCLDLFAGSGALGFEAASRGAELVTLVEANREVAKQLETTSHKLSADSCQIHNRSAIDYLDGTTQKYDIVFVDPPYKAGMWSQVAEKMVEKAILSDNAHIYLEYPSHINLPVLPAQWRIVKDKKAGAVRYCLLQNNNEE